MDAGHFQIETDLVSFAYDQHNPERAESFGVATTNFKVGLLHNVDRQLVVEPFNSVRTGDRAIRAVQKQSGFGDLTTRLKAFEKGAHARGLRAAA